MSVPIIKLNNGSQIPQLGLGVFRAEPGPEAAEAVAAALKAGYRHIDTAAAYRNEADVAEGIRLSGVPREEIFVTSKLSTADIQAEDYVGGTERSLERLGKIDLYLIHWPCPHYVEAYEVIERYYKEGKLGAIGVSNFEPHHLQALEAKGLTTPAVNQVELHPKFQQKELKAYCEERGIFLEAWSPLGGQGNLLFDEPTIVAIAEKHGKTPAQVIIRWHLQYGTIVIPKSVKAERIVSNFDVFGFELDAEDMAKMAALDTGVRTYYDPKNWDNK